MVSTPPEAAKLTERQVQNEEVLMSNLYVDEMVGGAVADDEAMGKVEAWAVEDDEESDDPALVALLDAMADVFCSGPVLRGTVKEHLAKFVRARVAEGSDRAAARERCSIGLVVEIVV